MVTLPQLLAVLVNIAQGGVDDERTGYYLTVKACELCSVERHELVGHDAAAAINGAVTAQCGILQRVGKMDGVGRIQLTVLEPLFDVHGVVFTVALFVGFLDAAAGRRIVVGYGEANHRAVVKLDGTLHESLAERAAAYDGGAVLVLQCAG